jgi:hypothetical protein
MYARQTTEIEEDRPSTWSVAHYFVGDDAENHMIYRFTKHQKLYAILMNANKMISVTSLVGTKSPHTGATWGILGVGPHIDGVCGDLVPTWVPLGVINSDLASKHDTNVMITYAACFAYAEYNSTVFVSFRASYNAIAMQLL